MSAHIRTALAAYDVQAIDTLIGDITPPESLMKTQTDRKIAEEHPNLERVLHLITIQQGPGEVLVRVRAAALNRADLLQRRGLYPPPPGYREDVPGLEFAGEVAALGAGVTLSAAQFFPGFTMPVAWSKMKLQGFALRLDTATGPVGRGK